MGKAMMMGLAALLCGACDGGAGKSGATTAGGSAAAIGQDCSSRCAAIAAACSAPANVAESVRELCAVGPSSAQLDCLSSESCAAIERLMKEGTPLCGLGGGAGGSGGATCTPVETNDEACPAGCSESYNVTGVTFCTAGCSRDSDCPATEGAPYKCFGGMCLVSCEDDGPCQGGSSSPFTHCDSAYGVCQ